MLKEKSVYPVFGTVTTENVIDNYDCVIGDLEDQKRWRKALRYVSRAGNTMMITDDALQLIEQEARKQKKSPLLPLVMISLLLYSSYRLKLYRQRIVFVAIIQFLDTLEWQENIRDVLGLDMCTIINQQAIETLNDLLSLYNPGTALVDGLIANAQTALVRGYLQGWKDALYL